MLEAQKAGIPAITVEMAGVGRALKGIIRRFETMIGNILAFFQMAPGESKLPEKLIHFEGTFINTVYGGFNQQQAEVLGRVQLGQSCATV